MAPADSALDNMPVISNPRDFDARSGGMLERFIFNHRLWVLAACALLTLFLGPHALKLPVNASFEKMIPQSAPVHPQLPRTQGRRCAALGNSVRIVVENPRGRHLRPRRTCSDAAEDQRRACS